jgi:uncharacterized protein (TIGR00255 family)
MIHSMTGFGRGEAGDQTARFEVEVRGVNHRFLEIRFRLPAELSNREPELRSEVAGKASRGRVDIWVNRVPLKEPEAIVAVSREMVARSLDAASALASEFHLPGSLSLESVLALPGAVRIDYRKDSAPDSEADALRRALGAALEEFEKARASEGEKLRSDLQGRLEALHSELAGVERIAADAPREISERIRRRMAQLLEGVALDEGRLAQEVAYLASRGDITEEIVRLGAHIREARTSLESPSAPVGKALDFLVQEMNREANTIGSKSENLAIAQAVLRIKAEVERIREQVQNLE